MSADVEVQRRCLQEHRDDFFFMREGNNSTQYTCKFLSCFDIENSIYDKCRWSLLYEISGSKGLKDLPSRLEFVMEFVLSNDIESSWLASSWEKYTVLLDNIRRDILDLEAPDVFSSQLGSNTCEKMWRCLIECFCNLQYYFSVPDLLLICSLADISVGIFVVQNEVLNYIASYIGTDSGENLISICLDTVPRGHFSRVVKMESVAALEENVKEQRQRERDETARMFAEECAELARIRLEAWERFIKSNPRRCGLNRDPPESRFSDNAHFYNDSQESSVSDTVPTNIERSVASSPKQITDMSNEGAIPSVTNVVKEDEDNSSSDDSDSQLCLSDDEDIFEMKACAETNLSADYKKSFLYLSSRAVTQVALMLLSLIHI